VAKAPAITKHVDCCVCLFVNHVLYYDWDVCVRELKIRRVGLPRGHEKMNA